MKPVLCVDSFVGIVQRVSYMYVISGLYIKVRTERCSMAYSKLVTI